MQYSIVDVETTGGSLPRHRVIEVAVVRMENDRVVDRFESLVHPECCVTPNITHLTGITNAMLQDAPRFFEIARPLLEFVQGSVFVAHNVSFDYAFFKSEYKQLGYNFQLPRLCTVRLARALMPGHASYSLGKLCRDLGIANRARHRAMGDADATAELFRRLWALDEQGLIVRASAPRQAKANLPPHVPDDPLAQLPEATGVYFFHDAEGQVVYVGKANNIRQRVKTHFAPDLASRKALKLKAAMHSISSEVTGHELIALLEESRYIKTLRPKFNTALKRVRELAGMYCQADEHGYLCLEVARLDPLRQAMATFSGKSYGYRYVEHLQRAHSLCPAKCGTHPGPGPCFSRQIGRCRGACHGAEPPEAYNQRVRKALERLSLKDRNLAILGPGRSFSERSAVLVVAGQYYGHVYYEQDEPVQGPQEWLERAQRPLPAPDRDSQRLIAGWLKANPQAQVLEWRSQPQSEAVEV